MTLDEAIKHCEEVAEKNDGEAEVYGLLAKNHNNPYEKLTASKFHADCAECSADHRQLAEWLTELKDLREETKVLTSECDRLIKEKGELLKKSEQIAAYKQLLKMAVPIINNSFPEVGSCWGCANHDEAKDECKGGAFAECAEVCKWKHSDEALALIGEEGDTE